MGVVTGMLATTKVRTTTATMEQEVLMYEGTPSWRLSIVRVLRYGSMGVDQPIVGRSRAYTN